MALTTAQKATLKTYIEANPAWMAYPHNSDGAFQIARELQDESSPAFVVWRTDVLEDEITGDTSAEGTTWDWVEFIGLTVGEQGGYARMFRDGVIDASKPNVRQGFIDIFGGPSGADQRAHMAAISKRNANLIEELFAVGTGSTASPATMEVEGSVGYREILTVMGW